MKKIVKYTIYIVIVIFLFVAVMYGVNYFQDSRIRKLKATIEDLKSEFVPIRFKVISYENGHINVAIKFYDSDNNEIVRKELYLKGEQLSFDFLVVKINDKYLAFPYKIFTDQIAPDDGEQVFQYYEKDEFPQIYYHQDINQELETSIADVYLKIKDKKIEEIEEIFGSMVQDIRKQNRFREKQIYKIVIRTKGGIEVLEDI